MNLVFDGKLQRIDLIRATFVVTAVNCADASEKNEFVTGLLMNTWTNCDVCQGLSSRRQDCTAEMETSIGATPAGSFRQRETASNQQTSVTMDDFLLVD
jgi:hypothetical protein